jgi:hypothetical protein
MPVILLLRRQGSGQSWANSSPEPVLKIPNTKRAGGVAQGVGLSSNPRTTKKKTKENYFSMNFLTQGHFSAKQLISLSYLRKAVVILARNNQNYPSVVATLEVVSRVMELKNSDSLPSLILHFCHF